MQLELLKLANDKKQKAEKWTVESRVLLVLVFKAHKTSQTGALAPPLGQGNDKDISRVNSCPERDLLGPKKRDQQTNQSRSTTRHNTVAFLLSGPL